ncbi:MAG: DNA (cytosine-5-)-methyltransferase [Trichlorobacter sp.]|uniref:DNA (cytosine-5-)-methyltransferase n=1 Tax=Trichlorobacter sp. TaxID=2911007 RepID=UPI002565A68E|nr:DNA (cytosine-5-)-methyltransferase [Trichlorobacter sp.]MDK9719245.1 DNA (cytosine-5-)-methyltransferase [Trichlorobacter sp.]
MTIKNHSTREYTGIVLERMKHLPIGGKMSDLPVHLQHESFVRVGDKNTGGPNMRLLRLEMDKPALTVTQYIFNKFVHPTEDRYITTREAACLQDFPVEYEFCGTLGQTQMQVGNAVPVRLAKAVAQEVAKYFERRNIGGEINIASFFTGAGGLDLGFEQASNEIAQFKTSFSTDIEECTEATVKANRPHWNFKRADIRELRASEILQVIGKRPLIVIGGPPCQPFSVAGKQKATDDPLGMLYRDFVHNVSELKPEIVIMENVYGLAQVKTANMIDRIYKSFTSIGYEITHRELMSADYGTPQKRRRLFFVAAKELHYFQFPQPTHCETVNLLGLPIYEGAGNSFIDLPKPTLVETRSRR